jgi:hypothetical protein
MTSFKEAMTAPPRLRLATIAVDLYVVLFLVRHVLPLKNLLSKVAGGGVEEVECQQLLKESDPELCARRILWINC